MPLKYFLQQYPSCFDFKYNDKAKEWRHLLIYLKLQKKKQQLCIAVVINKFFSVNGQLMSVLIET